MSSPCPYCGETVAVWREDIAPGGFYYCPWCDKECKVKLTTDQKTGLTTTVLAESEGGDVNRL